MIMCWALGFGLLLVPGSQHSEPNAVSSHHTFRKERGDCGLRKRWGEAGLESPQNNGFLLGFGSVVQIGGETGYWSTPYSLIPYSRLVFQFGLRIRVQRRESKCCGLRWFFRCGNRREWQLSLFYLSADVVEGNSMYMSYCFKALFFREYIFIWNNTWDFLFNCQPVLPGAFSHQHQYFATW
jgi:hypothetical protein